MLETKDSKIRDLQWNFTKSKFNIFLCISLTFLEQQELTLHCYRKYGFICRAISGANCFCQVGGLHINPSGRQMAGLQAPPLLLKMKYKSEIHIINCMLLFCLSNER